MLRWNYTILARHLVRHSVFQRLDLFKGSSAAKDFNCRDYASRRRLQLRQNQELKHHTHHTANDNRRFGWFKCKQCKNRWKSASTWIKHDDDGNEIVSRPIYTAKTPVLWEVHTKLVLILTPVGVSLILLGVKFNTDRCYFNTHQC